MTNKYIFRSNCGDRSRNCKSDSDVQFLEWGTEKYILMRNIERNFRVMYKMINIDLDGTLLNSLGEISEGNMKELRRCIDSGVEIVLTSGRVVSSIKNFAKEIGNNNYLIAGNGSTIYDINNEKIIYQNTIDKEKVLRIIKICEENSIFYNVYTEKYIISKALNYNVLFYSKENLKKLDNEKTNINIIEDIYKPLNPPIIYIK